MEKSDFLNFIKDLCAYYERKNPSPETLRFWFDEVYKFPGESLDEIGKQIRRLYESWPKNLPNVLREQFKLWLDRHPDKKAAEPKVGCQECGFTGFIKAWKPAPESHPFAGEPYTALWRCANCHTETLMPGIPALQRWEIQAKGYTVLENLDQPPRFKELWQPPPKPPRQKQIKEEADGVPF